MTASLPRLAHALLNRLALDNEPLAGDLAEEFHRRRSRYLALAAAGVRVCAAGAVRPHPPVALKLEYFDPVVAEWMMEKRLEKKRRVNLTGTGVEGIGGLTMVILGFMVSMVVPAIWWFVVGSMIAGLLCGAALVKFQRQVIKPLRPLTL